MTDTAHTPTPWALKSSDQIESTDDGANDGFFIAVTYGSEFTANAAHIVKCVNENEALHKRIAELEAVNIILVAGLQTIRVMQPRPSVNVLNKTDSLQHTITCIHKVAREALEKAGVVQ